MTEQSRSAWPSQGAQTPQNWQNLLRAVVINVALPWIAIQLLMRTLGVATVPAFALASLFPVVQTGMSWVRYRRVEVIGLAVLTVIVANILITLATHDVRFLLLKASPAFGLFGLACFASLAGKRPLMFFVSRYFTSGGDAAKAAAWTARLQQAGSRRSMWRLTVTWGAACLAEAALSVCAAFFLLPNVAVIVEPILGIATIAGLLAWTAAYARQRAVRVAAPTGHA